MPFIVLGSLIGRLYVELLALRVPISQIGRFSVAGAAALSATSTRFLSMSILLLEITQDFSMLYPILITVAVSFGIGGLFSKTYFYSTIELRDLPYVPKLMNKQVYKMKVKDIMEIPSFFLHSNSTLADVFNYLVKGIKLIIFYYSYYLLNNFYFQEFVLLIIFL